MNITTIAKAYVETEAALYSEAARQRPKIARRKFPVSKQRIWMRRTESLTEWLEERDVNIPPEIMTPYDLDVIDRVRAFIPLKYQFRALNGLRELARTHVMFPELLRESEPREIIDLSAGGCGIADALGYFGHKVDICDYFDENKINPVGDSYAEIHRLLGLTCRVFDGRSLPYGFADNSYDIVLVHQAIDAYGPVSVWSDIVDELLRIARLSVGFVLNPATPKTPENVEKAAAFIADLERDRGAVVSECPETGLPMVRIDKQ